MSQNVRNIATIAAIVIMTGGVVAAVGNLSTVEHAFAAKVKCAPGMVIKGNICVRDKNTNPTDGSEFCYSLSAVRNFAGTGGAGGAGGPTNLQRNCFDSEFECNQKLQDDPNAASGQDACFKEDKEEPKTNPEESNDGSEFCYSLTAIGNAGTGGAGGTGAPTNLQRSCFDSEFECNQKLQDDPNAASGQDACFKEDTNSPSGGGESSSDGEGSGFSEGGGGPGGSRIIGG